jgi:integrase
LDLGVCLPLLSAGDQGLPIARGPSAADRLADAIGERYRALVLVGAYGGLRIGELAGLRRRGVDLLRGRVDVAEIVVEVRGELFMGPP